MKKVFIIAGTVLFVGQQAGAQKQATASQVPVAQEKGKQGGAIFPEVENELNVILNQASFKVHPYLSISCRQARRLNRMVLKIRQNSKKYNASTQAFFMNEVVKFIQGTLNTVTQYVNTFDRATFYAQYPALKAATDDQKLLYNSRLYLIAVRGILVNSINSGLTDTNQEEQLKGYLTTVTEALKVVTRKLNGLTNLTTEMGAIVKNTEGQAWGKRAQLFNELFNRLDGSGELFPKAQQESFYDMIKKDIIDTANMNDIKQVRFLRSILAKLRWAGTLISREDRIVIRDKEFHDVSKTLNNLQSQNKGQGK